MIHSVRTSIVTSPLPIEKKGCQSPAHALIRLFSGQRQFDNEPAPFSLFALYFHSSTMGRGDGLDDGKSQPGPSMSARGRTIGLAKRLKELPLSF